MISIKINSRKNDSACVRNDRYKLNKYFSCEHETLYWWKNSHIDRERKNSGQRHRMSDTHFFFSSSSLYVCTRVYVYACICVFVCMIRCRIYLLLFLVISVSFSYRFLLQRRMSQWAMYEKHWMAMTKCMCLLFDDVTQSDIIVLCVDEILLLHFISATNT